MGSETLHEPFDSLSDETRNLHRGVVSLIEELEAIDWYQQRAEACTDEALKRVLMHNRNEEIEHAMMNLEWIRRHEPVFERNMRTYLFAEGPITEIEADKKGADAEEAGGGPSSLGIGSLRRG